MRNKGIFFSVLIWTILFGCSEDKDLEPRTSFVDSYYPISAGMERTFQVDSISYDFNANLDKIVIDTNGYYLKQVVGDKTVVNGVEWYMVNELTSDAENGDYDFERLILERVENGRLYVKPGNFTFIPLSSPLTLYDEWDGTALFDRSAVEIFVKGEIIKPYENWKYIFTENNATLNVQGNVYNDVIRINQADTSSLESVDEMGNPVLFPPEKQLFYELANEWYAPGKGLVMKEEIKLISICASSSVAEFQDFCDSTTIFENAERGYIYRQKLISIE